ncbi:MAG: TetR/AcrR family transcriptional regulator C-terminal domain-containing protein [Rhizobacter sp.]|nr:TetR/AcrR family transcriptional regulator C-terminal domain-containing protein [Rhizobacter sp.]
MKNPKSPLRPRPGRSDGLSPAAPLSPARILDAALAEIAEVGLAGLSTRRLGQRLGCEAMSIYHHFPSKQHLLDALVDHALQSIGPPDAEASPVEQLRQALHGWRAMAHRWPALFPLVAVHRLNTPTGVAFIEAMLGLVRQVVPDDELAARHFRILGYYLMGSCLDETSGYAKGPSAADPVSGDYIAAHCPRLVASATYFQQSQWDRTFDMGLESLVEAAVRDGKRLARAGS